MGKAFVAKLAKEGARDPEALAAWIGRRKHGAQAFAKLAAAGRKKSKQPRQAQPRDMQRGFRPGSDRFATSDDDVAALRRRVASERELLAKWEAQGLGDSEVAARTRREVAQQEQQIADAEYARETLVGQREYSAAVEAERAAVNEALEKARRSRDPDDWAAAADAAEKFSQKAGQSPYGQPDASWFSNEARRAREAVSQAQSHRDQQAIRKAERTLPPPRPGETPVAHAAHLDSDGAQAFGDPSMGRKAIGSSPGVTAMPDTGAEGHDSVLQRVSPAFRKKVREARESGLPWLHNITHDSDGAEIHTLQVVGPAGKVTKITFLERNSKRWKAKERR